MQFLNKLIQHVALTEAADATAVCNDATKISALAKAAAKYLKREGDKDISKMPMALITGQVRSSVDASLLADKVKLGKDALEKVVVCVMKDIQQNAKAYKLVEAELTPEQQLNYVNQTKKDELEVLKAELAEESDAKKRNLIRNQISQVRTDIAKGKRGVAEGYNAVPLETILNKFAKEYAAFKDDGELDPGSDFYAALYDFYDDQMPYGVQKARDGDPVEWISDKLSDE
jgi:hypothetical protein